jgi:hypothetical protein
MVEQVNKNEQKIHPILDFFSLVKLISLSIFQDIDFIFTEECDFFRHQ